MRFRKIYGQSKEDSCIFCSKQGVHQNKQGFPVCRDHKDREMEEKRCVCGELMQVKESKWGAFFLCPQCGPISQKKAKELGEGDFKLNKRFRKENKPGLKSEKPVTMNYPAPIHKDRVPAQEASSDTTNKKKPGPREEQEKGNDKADEKVYTLDELKMLWD